MNIAGLRVRVSDAVTFPPSGRPFTEDMRLMVEHFDVLGLIQRVPGALRMGDMLVVHSRVFRDLMAQLPGPRP